MYNGKTNCDRAWLHTWIRALPWQLALRIKHLQFSMLTHDDVIGSKVYGQLRSIQTKALWRELPIATTHFGFWINPSLLRPSWPYVSWNQHWNGTPFGFQCCFLVNQDRIVTKNRSISKTKIHICQLHRSLKTSVIWIALSGLNLKPIIHIFVFIPASIQAWAFWQQEQRNRNTGKQEHLWTGTSEDRNIGNGNIWKQEHLKTGTFWKQEHLKTGTEKQEQWKAVTMDNWNIWKQQQKNR